MFQTAFLNFSFYLQTMLLGIGLAMDACAVSMTNGLKEPHMKFGKIFLIALLFGLFQGIMPLIGYFVGNAFIQYIKSYIPWIALIILSFLGIKMIVEGIKNKQSEAIDKDISLNVLFIQSIATSIDALGVGLTFSNYLLIEAVIAVTIISVITFGICLGSVYIGKIFGNKLENKAIIIGGIILILIGLEIFLNSFILQ